MSEKYFKFINRLAKIGYDKAEEPSYCDVWDDKELIFKRRNDLLDDLLNHPETQEMTKLDFEQTLSRRQVQHAQIERSHK